MRSLKTLLTAALIATAIPTVGASVASAQSCSCEEGAGPRASRAEVYADEAPPPLPEYEQPPLPAPGYLWTPGYWAWNSYEYYWVPGTWVEPPRVGYLWTPGYWGYADGEYGFHRGYWGERIGFYGGVSYGYGYYGAGFVGGRWDGDHYYYNSTVNNFGSVNITNVYEQPAPRVSERASFNGGPDGIHARATPAELAVGRQTHLPPTADQRQNARVASRTESAFVSSNQGKPPVAATAKPGELKGAAIVPAKAAGGPLPQRKPETPLPGSAKTEGGKPLLDTGAKGGQPAGEAEHKKDDKAGRTEPGGAAETTPDKPKNERERHKAGEGKPELRDTKSEPDQVKPEEKVEKPKVEKERRKPEDAEAKPERAKTEVERPKPPEPKVERPRVEERRQPEPERPRVEERRQPEPERPRVEERRQPEPERPRVEERGPRAEPPRQAEHRGGGEGPKCHPGAPNCPK